MSSLFDDAFSELVEIHVALREWFGENGPRHWVPELDQDLKLLVRHDAYGFDRFLSHFGSMGSIGDIGVGDAESRSLARNHPASFDRMLSGAKHGCADPSSPVSADHDDHIERPALALKERASCR